MKKIVFLLLLFAGPAILSVAEAGMLSGAEANPTTDSLYLLLKKDIDGYP